MTVFRLASTAFAAAALALALAGPALADVPAPADTPYPGTLVLNVDATDLSQQIFRVHMTIPVKPGPLTLLYPQWLPANHGPNGPITQLAGLKFTANGKPVEWKRDPLHVFAFHLDVPAGATVLEADYQYLSPLDAGQGRTTMTDDILGVQWISTTLYPAGYVARGVNVQANLKLPAGWQYATALETDGRAGDDVRFRTSDLETLLDSPLFAGRYSRRFDLDPNGKVRVTLNVFADSPDSLEAKPEQVAAHRALVQQAYKLYGSHHYDHYDFLFALSDEFGGIGREHHQSSENGVKPGYFTDWARNEAVRELLPHEYTHSWNGKFRRPAGQNVPNFNTPMDNELLWVYEGQTQYWGHVLAARSGLVSPTGARDALAASAARYDSIAGRTWRAVQDTVYDPIMNARRGLGWPNWQRSEDYYVEGMLIWLDVDTRIRELSGEKRSLDDFARAFYGVNDGSRLPAFYTFEDVVATLNRVQPYDWATFLRTKLDGHGPGAPLDGLARAGWKLVYTDTPTDYLKADDERRKVLDLTYSLGFTVAQDGAIRNVVWDGLAFRAGLAANATVMAVNDRVYKPEGLTAAIKDAKNSGRPIRLLVRKGSVLRTVALDYRGGLRYPRLERIPGTKDRLETILAARK